jgi:hypothetical protein
MRTEPAFPPPALAVTEAVRALAELEALIAELDAVLAVCDRFALEPRRKAVLLSLWMRGRRSQPA